MFTCDQYEVISIYCFWELCKLTHISSEYLYDLLNNWWKKISFGPYVFINFIVLMVRSHVGTHPCSHMILRIVQYSTECFIFISLWTSWTIKRKLLSVCASTRVIRFFALFRAFNFVTQQHALLAAKFPVWSKWTIFYAAF
jgi:hypothetical protein